jgi:hypothetical protein
MTTTPEQDALLTRMRAIDSRFFARWPDEKVRIRRPYPGEIEAMAAMPGATQFGICDPKAIYMVMCARAMVNGLPGHITMAEAVAEIVPPDGVRGKPAEFMFANTMARQGIDVNKPVTLNGPERA